MKFNNLKIYNMKIPMFWKSSLSLFLLLLAQTLIGQSAKHIVPKKSVAIAEVSNYLLRSQQMHSNVKLKLTNESNDIKIEKIGTVGIKYLIYTPGLTDVSFFLFRLGKLFA